MARILIADDEREIRELLAALVAEEGYEVEAVGDGLEVLAAVERQQPDLILLDVMMPDLDGFGVLKELAARGAGDVRVLLLTARTAESDWLRGLRLGADRYLTKPFDLDNLLDAVEDMLSLTKDQLRKEREQELDRAQLLWRLESLFEA